jgi:hypothetical protein
VVVEEDGVLHERAGGAEQLQAVALLSVAMVQAHEPEPLPQLSVVSTALTLQ